LTNTTEPVANRARSSAEVTHPIDREISTLVQPEVALHQSRIGNARRQFTRLAVRSLSVLAGDAVAIAAVSTMVNAAVRSVATSAGVSLPTVGVGQVCVAMIVCLALTGNYQRSSPAQLHFRLLTGAALGAIVVYWPSVWSAHALLAIPLAAVLLLGASAALVAMRFGSSALVSRFIPDEKRLAPAIVLTADANTAAHLPPAAGYRVAGSMVLDRRHSDARMRDLARLIRRTRAETVIVYGQVNGAQLGGIAEISLRAGCEFLAAAPSQGVQGVRSSFVWRGPCAFLRSEAPKLEAPQLLAKRCVDVVGSLTALVLGLPVCALVALAIRLDSPGPIFFRQERVGLGGRRFQMLKFRTMHADADRRKLELEHLNVSGDRRLFKIPNDPRISRVGRFLRQWSLDELPQFVNVLSGQMSLVGPRPFFEDDFVDYEDHHFLRLGVKPGITGLWQVYGRSDVMDFEEVIRMDREYIDRWSIGLDLKILCMTIPAVCSRTGAF
jgi:exopolysaccharide biosynthesis polyprenyl glycosylphosphotransferase